MKSYRYIYRHNKTSNVRNWFWGFLIGFGLLLFVPWTQNIKSSGKVTTLYQEQRPQEINSRIPGRIIKWYAKEGDYLRQGDTILQLSEIKEDYLDPNLVQRTQQQADAKQGAIHSYSNKLQAISNQIAALQNALTLKRKQLEVKRKQIENKLLSDQAELKALQNETTLAEDQYKRQVKMFEEGLVSQTQVQQRNMAYQQALAKKTMVENKLAQTQQELINNALEMSNAEQEYNEKISKAESERYQGMGQVETGKGELAKLQNQISNYTIRNGMYFLLAPQDGQLTQARSAGIGEVIKEGEKIALIIPAKTNLAVELFVRPVDLPLISKGQKVRFIFDGFPAVVFSGWPNSSYGTFGGRIKTYENNISPNGKFRVLVVPDSTDRPWPEYLRIGTGAQGIALLKNVPIWYELWRNINGFPPDYYVTDESPNTKK